MIARYRVLAERLRAELQALEQVVARTQGAIERAALRAEDRDYFIAAAALDLHGFYAGVERMFDIVAAEIDGTRLTGVRWHRDLIMQMTLAVPDVRPALVTNETAAALTDYLEFRHVVRNVYTFNLRSERVTELVHGLRPAFEQTQREVLAFVAFLEPLATADEDQQSQEG